jgi:hypothetical protein
MIYLLKSHSGSWEQVTKYVFDNRKLAIDLEGNARYDGDYMIIEGREITMNGTITFEEMGKLSRYLKLETPMGAYSPIINEPETVNFKRGNSVTLHCLKTGENWKRQAAR